MTNARKTPLYDAHCALGGRMVDFAGFEMPIQYDGILAEHARVRERVGLFDVSHMGEVRVRGADALDAVNHLITNDVRRVGDGRALYTCLCADDGTIVDDLIVYRIADDDVFICVNAANRATDFAHMQAHLPAGLDATLTDEADDWAQIAVQGPHAPELLGRVFGAATARQKPFRIRTASFDGADCYYATTGYTGEPGAEIYLRPDLAPALWARLLEAGEDLGVGPAGLGARDTLRLEMGYCLYGNDIDRTTTPLEAGLGWVVKLDKPDFVGAAALRDQVEAVPRALVGLEVTERAIPRHGYPVLDADGAPVGVVTSGTKSPSTGRSIALAYVPTALSAIGTALQVDCRGKARAAVVTATPFYTRAS